MEEEEEQIEPPSTPSLSNDKEVSTEAHSFITIHLQTFHQASFIQCLKEPSYAKTLKDLCKQASKSRNHCPKKIPLSNKVGYLRWRNILPKGYQIRKKKGWRDLLDNQLIGESTIKFLPHFNLCTFFFFLFLSFYFCF